MRASLPLLIMLLTGCHTGPSTDADDVQPAASTAVVATAPAAPVEVVLGAEQAKRLGIVSVALTPASAGASVAAFARVIDPQPLFQSLHDRALARAALAVSDANRQRIDDLFAHDGNASMQERDAARAIRAQDAARVQWTQRQLQVQWGGPLAGDGGDALAERLAAGTVALLRIEADGGMADAVVPLAAHWLRDGDRPLDATRLWPAPSRDPASPGPVFFALVDPAQGLRPGMRGAVALDLPGPATAGVWVPRAALVYAQAMPSAYVETGVARWQRRALDVSLMRADGYVQVAGFAVGERVVIQGAGILLAAERGDTLGGDEQNQGDRD
ncbi:MAG: hypothetical protein NW204_10770 [Xanthomonadaceae bacterium]|nr:hypothetical protein [Xanthomonadaceae bacterium]